MPPETIEVDRVRPETRGLMLVPSSINEEQRTVEYVLATEEPAPRYSWRHGEFDEVLLCGPENIDTTRIERGVCPWLLEHNRWDPKAKVGTITGHRIENRQLIVTVRYDQTDEAEETFQRVRRGELPAASAGYVVEAYDVEERDGRRDLRKATRWSVYEGSIVTVPADHNASQRSGNQGNQQEVEVRLRRRGAQMPPEDNDGPQQGTRSSQSPPSQPQGQGGTAQAPATGSEGNRSSSAGETAQPPVQQRQAQAPPQNTQPAPAQAPQPQDGARTASLEFILGRGASAGLTAQEAQEMATRGLTEAQVVDDLFARLRQRSGPDGSNTHRVEVTTEEHVKLRQVAEGVILNRIDNAAYPLEGDAVGSDLRGRSLLDIGERIQARMGRALAGSTQAERAAE
ncbi:MAG: HK97 family phage prohead protease, partial [Planctomycetota bacterium]